jgi:hypothetical protein
VAADTSRGGAGEGGGAPGGDPATRPGRFAYRVALDRVTEWGPRTRSLFLRLPAGTSLPFTPGQFVSLELPAGDDPPLVRAYSLASSPEDGDRLEICVDLVPGGPGSTYLFGLRPGATLDLKGPFGSFRLDVPPAAEMVLIGDGTGIAPIRPMVRRALERGGSHPIRVLHGTRPGRGRTRACAGSRSRRRREPPPASTPSSRRRSWNATCARTRGATGTSGSAASGRW